ncbi:serine/threonine protein kinase [Spizellomyces punctatus DAOM BR117]|uniref:non-specific serine/threonine protein kinase n=1 Tax=Spizellomyces punctatus (strain DAOM BR117) TaxID=645134 RepID=A0A0L0HC60_SPIPD|nr:serine/threonine protein kinase [Spizellomyces punctatus DAOM BR117]KNC98521.1 serine/threonine protein kinase [Spizellomyces punctatus DAOM BR117]|eukprot:XP_016606561.1 serine/threonine protein kinase [Spizellomyces punctatus DAOM BR117]
MSKRPRRAEERKELDPTTVLTVENVEREVNYRLPYFRKDRKPPAMGSEGVVEFVTTGPAAAGEEIQTAARKYIKPDISNASTTDPRGAREPVTYELAELEVLQAVSERQHMPTFLGAVDDHEKIYMYYRPWCPTTIRDWLERPFIPNSSELPTKASLQKYGQQLMLCLTVAIHELHTLKPPVLHRDIKPENFCLTDEGRLVCVDFGVSRLCKDTSVRRTYAGTVKYMAPEVANAQRYSRPAEVFSLGAVFCEILCLMSGVRPGAVLDPLLKNGNYSSERIREKALRFLEMRCRDNENLKDLLVIIREMLSTNPHDRPEAWKVHDRLRLMRTDYTCCQEELPDEEAEDIPSPPSEEDEEALANYNEFE